MEGAPLTHDFGQRARVDDLVVGHSGKLVGGGIADTVARGLNRMHLYRCQFCQNIGHFF
jgi:hypothetical protein